MVVGKLPKNYVFYVIYNKYKCYSLSNGKSSLLDFLKGLFDLPIIEFDVVEVAPK
jgi:hypothetical protein